MGCRQPEVGGWPAGGVDGRAASGGRPAIYIRTHADMQAENLHAATARWGICVLAVLNTLAQGVALMKKMFGVDVDHRCGCPLTTGSRHDGWGAVLFADRVDCKQIGNDHASRQV